MEDEAKKRRRNSIRRHEIRRLRLWVWSEIEPDVTELLRAATTESDPRFTRTLDRKLARIKIKLEKAQRTLERDREEEKAENAEAKNTANHGPETG